MKDQEEDFQLIDIREPFEYDIVHIGGDRIPMARIMHEKDKVAHDKKVVVYCRSGGRSSQVVQALATQGFDNVYNLKGGVLAWVDEIDPSLEKY